VQASIINVELVPTLQMQADGFTKIFNAQVYVRFIKQLNIVDIEHLLKSIKGIETPKTGLSPDFQG
jgi:hypothetical protein